MKYILTILALCILTLCTIAHSQVPQKISYQGLLTTSSGTPVADGSYDLKFEIFNLPAAGTMRHSETQTGVTVQRGTFSVILGTATALTLAFNESLYVEVTAVSGPTGPTYPLTFSPRSELTSAPYALAPWATSGNNIYYDRKVGIGTDSPSNNLHIYDSVDTFIGSTIENPCALCDFSSAGIALRNGAGSAEMVLHGKDAISSPSDLELSNNISGGNVRLRTLSGSIHLDQSGSVGIGTSVPGAMLDVVTGGNAIASYLGEPSGGRFRFQVAPGGGAATSRIGYIFGAFGNRFRIGNNGMGPLEFATGSTSFGADPSVRMTIEHAGNVGIGTTSPQNKLHTRGSLQIENESFTTYGFVWDNRALGTSSLILSSVNYGTNTTFTDNIIVADRNGNIGMGDQTPDAKLDVEESGSTVAVFNRTSNDGTVIAIQQAGTEEGTISVSGTTVSYNAFTGSHYGWTDEVIETGTLVSFTGSNRRFHNNEKSEVIYGIIPSVRADDPACLGAYLGLQESSQPEGSENPHLVMAVGNGEMWVTDDGKNIEPGDYLISSDVRGHAMKDDEERFSIGHVVARAAENVDWSGVTESIDGRKHKRISVLFGNFVRSSTSLLSKKVDAQQKEIQDLKTMVKSLVEQNQAKENKSLGELK